RLSMEPLFGFDFSKVRLHTDGQAAQSARAVNALAYTVGRDIVFDSGQYEPNTGRGNRLLAHELTHVIQQEGSASQSMQHLQVGPGDDAAEQEAHSVSDMIASASPSVPRLKSGLLVRRLEPATTTSQPQTEDSNRLPDGSAVCGSHSNQQALAQ